MIPIQAIRDFCPATLSPLPIAAAQIAKLAAKRTAEREYDLGLMMYAHLYRETCRARHVAILHHHADRALQARWQEQRGYFIARALADYERAALIERAETCAAGFDELRRAVSADVTRSYAQALAAGMPAALYSYQIAAQEQRLIEKRAAEEKAVRLIQSIPAARQRSAEYALMYVG